MLPRTKWRGLLLLAAVLTTYMPVRNAGYVWDDNAHVLETPAQQSLAFLKAIWMQPGATQQYYPLTYTAFWAQAHAWSSPAGYHAVNVVLHAINAVLVWTLLAELRVPYAWFMALVFAVHPMQVESVAWISELKNLLSAFFYLLAFLALLRRKWAGGYFVALALYGCAILSKSVTVSLPVSYLLVRWWRGERVGQREILAMGPFFVLGVAMAATTVYVEHEILGARGTPFAYSLGERLVVAGHAWWFYIGKSLWPNPITFVYPKWHVLSGLAWLYPISAAAVLIALWTFRDRIGRGPFTALAYTTLTLVPALGLINVFPMTYTFVADHYAYLAMIGLMVLWTGVPASALKRFASEVRWAPAALGSVIACLLALTSAVEIKKYHSFETLWLDTLAKNPESAMAHNNLAGYYFEQGRLQESLYHVKLATLLNPNDPGAKVNLIRLEKRLGVNQSGQP